jgi:hypothetical protein
VAEAPKSFYRQIDNHQSTRTSFSLTSSSHLIFLTEHRDQMNLASSFLDASAIYGNTDQQVEKLRTYDAGLVNVSACSSCRSNALYSAILREHNRVAVNLAQLNRHWTDESLFLESRRIVTASIQHITYNEFLPTVLGNVSQHSVIGSLSLTVFAGGYRSV